MGRYCADCGDYLNSSEFSSNQWRKGDSARCRQCVESCYGYSYSYECPDCSQSFGSQSELTRHVDQCHRFACGICHREFKTQNNLNMHMQVHRPKTVACPVCGDQRFKSGANAVQHVESGFCRGCKGQANARQQIYDFASRQRAMRPHMSDVPLLENGGRGGQGVPDFPYCCAECSKSFRQLSQLLQHQDQKHGNRRLLTY
jgi:DNA-directed RNA polymerase subunit RPC12/RpoP